MNSITNILQLNYWFDSNINYTFPYFWLAVILLTLLFCISVILSFTVKINKHQLATSIVLWLKWFTLCALILIFWRNQSLAIFNLRIWWLVVTIGFGFWLWQIFRKNISKHMPLETKTKRYQTFDKYLPRSNRSRAS